MLVMLPGRLLAKKDDSMITRSFLAAAGILGTLLCASVPSGSAKAQANVEAEALQNSLRIKTAGKIALSVDIGAERVSRRFTNIPVQWVDKSANGRLLTKTVEVEVFGPKSLVEAMRPDEVRVEVNKTGLPLDTTTLTPIVKLPAQVEKNIEDKTTVPREVKVKR